MLGYGGDNEPDRFGITHINFNHSPVTLEKIEEALMEIDITNTTFSDADGNLLFYTNGCQIANAEHEVMENSEGLNPGLIAEQNCEGFGYTAGSQGCMVLPMPNSDSIFF